MIIDLPKIRSADLTILAAVFLLAAGGCGLGGRAKTEEVTSGRLKYVETLRYGRVGPHGGRGWYVDGREIFIDGRSWSPPEGDVRKAVGGCEASPNAAVEALKCHSFAENQEIVYVLRVKDERPVWTTVYRDDSIKGRGENLGEWIDDGRALIFKDFFYFVETGEKREIKGLPDYPGKYFRAVAPDLKTVVYQGDCFFDPVEVAEEIQKNKERLCAESARRNAAKLEVLWLIETGSGAAEFIERSRDKYDWLAWNREKFGSRAVWLEFFQKQLAWEKDRDGKFRLVAPE